MISTDLILDKIEAEQSNGNSYYPFGIFPSQRVHPIIKYVREDNNIFFSSLVVFTLNQLRPLLNDLQQSRVNRISNAVRTNYSNYLHKKSPDTYNFWPSGDKTHFPHGWLLHRITALALPADTDDTSMVYLTQPGMDIELLKKEYQRQYPNERPSSPLTHHEYRDLKAYPTFLGKRIAREMDACVICNVLYLIFKHQLPLTEIDFDSLEFLKRVLKRGHYLLAPFEISPNYANSSVILYHLARLTAAFEQDLLRELRELTIYRIKSEIEKPRPFMEKLLLKTSLHRLGVNTPTVSVNQVSRHFDRFYFFHAGMLTGLQRTYLKRLTANPLFHLKYRCRAYYWVLVLEYLLLAENYNSSRS